MNSIKEPADIEEAAQQYVSVADQLGFKVTMENILEFLKADDSCDVIINSYASKPAPIPAKDCENNALNFTVGTYQSKGQGTGEHEWDKWDVFDHCQGLPNDDWQ